MKVKCIQLKEALKSTLRFMLVWSHIRKCEEVEKGLLEDKKSQDLCKRLVVQLDDNTEPQEIKRKFLKIME